MVKVGNALRMHTQWQRDGHLRACPWRIIRALVNSGVNVDQPEAGSNKTTPLMRACANLPQPMAIVRLLAPGPCPCNVFFLIPYYALPRRVLLSVLTGGWSLVTRLGSLGMGLSWVPPAWGCSPVCPSPQEQSKAQQCKDKQSKAKQS